MATTDEIENLDEEIAQLHDEAQTAGGNYVGASNAAHTDGANYVGSENEIAKLDTELAAAKTGSDKETITRDISAEAIKAADYKNDQNIQNAKAATYHADQAADNAQAATLTNQLTALQTPAPVAAAPSSPSGSAPISPTPAPTPVNVPVTAAPANTPVVTQPANVPVAPIANTPVNVPVTAAPANTPVAPITTASSNSSEIANLDSAIANLHDEAQVAGGNYVGASNAAKADAVKYAGAESAINKLDTELDSAKTASAKSSIDEKINAEKVAAINYNTAEATENAKAATFHAEQAADNTKAATLTSQLTALETPVPATVVSPSTASTGVSVASSTPTPANIPVTSVVTQPANVPVAPIANTPVNVPVSSDGGVGQTGQAMTANALVSTGSSSNSSSTYTVKGGDTLSAIAAANGVSLSHLESLNPQIGNPNLITPGEEVHLPASVPTSSTYPPQTFGNEHTAVQAAEARTGSSIRNKLTGWFGGSGSAANDPAKAALAVDTHPKTDPMQINDNNHSSHA